MIKQYENSSMLDQYGSMFNSFLDIPSAPPAYTSSSTFSSCLWELSRSFISTSSFSAISSLWCLDQDYLLILLHSNQTHKLALPVILFQ